MHKGEKEMNKGKICNTLITLSAIIGVIILIGTVGNVDYLTTVGQDSSMSEIIKFTVLGIVLIITAIIREVKIYHG